jgi:hypothetical protein
MKKNEPPEPIVRPKGGKRLARAMEMKIRADERLLLLLKRGALVDRLSAPASPIEECERGSLDFQKELANAPKIVQFAYRSNMLKDLMKDLKELETSGNRHKMEINKPIIEKQIAEQETAIRELHSEIKKEMGE